MEQDIDKDGRSMPPYVGENNDLEKRMGDFASQTEERLGGLTARCDRVKNNIDYLLSAKEVAAWASPEVKKVKRFFYVSFVCAAFILVLPLFTEHFDLGRSPTDPGKGQPQSAVDSDANSPNQDKNPDDASGESQEEVLRESREAAARESREAAARKSREKEREKELIRFERHQIRMDRREAQRDEREAREARRRSLDAKKD